MPSYVGVGTVTLGTGTLAQIPVPSNYQEGDLLIMFVNTANAPVPITTGWRHVPGSPIGNGTINTVGATRLTAFWKIAGPNEPVVSNNDVFNYRVACIAAFRDVDPIAPFDVVSTSRIDGSNTTSKSWPTITTKTDNTLIINAIGLDRDAASTTTLASWVNASLSSITEIVDQTSSAGHGGGLGIAYGAKTTAGAVSATTATSAVSLTDVYLTIALRHVDPTLSLKGLNQKITSLGTFDAISDKFSCLKDLQDLLNNMNSKRSGGSNVCTGHIGAYTGHLALGSINAIIDSIRPCVCNADSGCPTYAPGTNCSCNTQSCSCNANCSCNSQWSCSCQNVGGSCTYQTGWCVCEGEQAWCTNECGSYYCTCVAGYTAGCSCNSETCSCNANCSCNSQYACTCQNVTGACTCNTESVCTCNSFFS